MNLGQNGAAGCLPGPPLQHFPAKCLSFPTCKKGVRPAVGTQQFAQDKRAVWRPYIAVEGDWEVIAGGGKTKVFCYTLHISAWEGEEPSAWILGSCPEIRKPVSTELSWPA